MYLSGAPQWHELNFVVIEWTMEMDADRYSGSGIIFPQQIDSDFCLRKEFVPEFGGEAINYPCKNAENEVLYGYFVYIVAMTARGDEFVGHFVLVSDEHVHGLGDFIV